MTATGSSPSPRTGLGVHNPVHRPGTSVGKSLDGPGIESPVGIRLSAMDQVAAFQRAAVSANTQRGYDTDWRAFVEWAGRHEHSPIPADPNHVAQHLAEMANLRAEDGKYHYAVNSVMRRLAAINKAHQLAHLTMPGTHPDVLLTVAGIRRTRKEPERAKKPILLGALRHILEEIPVHSWPGGVIGHRDSTLLLFGFVGAYRRSELAFLTMGDVTEHPEDGLHVRLRWSKTDQEGNGRTNVLPFGEDTLTCAPCWFRRWLLVIDQSLLGRPQAMRQVRESNTADHICQTGEPLPNFHPDEPLFRPVLKNGRIVYKHISGNVVNSTVHRRAAASGINDLELGAHSLRAGFVTQSFRDGATQHEVMRQTGHRDVGTVEGYSRDHDPKAHNAVMKIKL
jgi:integrase